MDPRKAIEAIAEAPAQFLEREIEAIEKFEEKAKKPFHAVKEYANTLGPGLVTGAADDDPSGIATYSQVGARYGYQFLWLSLFSFPLMSVVQEMCARIGIVTGRGLAANIRLHYPTWVLYLCTGLLFFANTLNLGADLGAMAKAAQLLYPAASFGWLVIGMGVGIMLLQIFTTYARYAQYLKYLTLVLFSYVIAAFMIRLDWSTVFHYTFVPHIPPTGEALLLICAVLGTTISPYLFFWQTSQEVEEEILKGRTTVKERQQHTTAREIRRMRVDVWTGMFVSNLVMFFIIAVCGATLAANGITNIETADQAAQALRPLAGDGAYFLFALGIIGTGLLAIPVLAGSASYAVSESFKWRTGLYRKLKEAYAFYGIIIIAMAIGIAINLLGFDPIKALIYSAVVNGIIAPIMLVVIVQLSSDRKVMLGHANHPAVSVVGWVTVFLMSFVALATIGTWLLQ